MYQLSKINVTVGRINPKPRPCAGYQWNAGDIYTASVHHTTDILPSANRNVKYKCTNLPRLYRQFRWQNQNPPIPAPKPVFPSLTRPIHHAKIGPQETGGTAMKWNEMSTLQKAVCVVSLLCVIAYCTVSILSFELGVLENTRTGECLLCAMFCLGFGFVSTGLKRVGWYLFSAFEFLLFLIHWIIR